VKLHAAFGAKCTAAVLYAASIAGGLSMIHWRDLEAMPPFWTFCGALGCYIVGSFGSISLMNTHLSQRMIPELQGFAASINIACGMAGRSLGPILTTFAFGRVREATDNESRLSDNLVLVIQFAYMLTAFGITGCFWSWFFDTHELGRSPGQPLLAGSQSCSEDLSACQSGAEDGKRNGGSTRPQALEEGGIRARAAAEHDSVVSNAQEAALEAATASKAATAALEAARLERDALRDERTAARVEMEKQLALKDGMIKVLQEQLDLANGRATAAYQQGYRAAITDAKNAAVR